MNYIFFAVPSAPVDISVELLNSTAVTLKWSPPFSPNGNILYYKITYYGYKASEDDPKVNIIMISCSATNSIIAIYGGLKYYNYIPMPILTTPNIATIYTPKKC